jgi:elongation factor Ts
MKRIKGILNLRRSTGIGFLSCKKAWENSNGNLSKAFKILERMHIKENNFVDYEIKNVIKREGIVESYIHFNKRVGSMIEINCKTDFTSKSKVFKKLAKDICIHIASGFNPKYISIKEVPENIVEKKRLNLNKKIKNFNKKDKNNFNIKIELKLWLKKICLLEQPFCKDPNKTIKYLINEVENKVKERISINRFSYFNLNSN